MTPAEDDCGDKPRKRKPVNLSRLGKTNKIPAKAERPRTGEGRSETHTDVVFHPRCVDREVPICLGPALFQEDRGQVYLFRGYRVYDWPRDKLHLSPVNGTKYFLLQLHRCWGLTDKCTVSRFKR